MWKVWGTAVKQSSLLLCIFIYVVQMLIGLYKGSIQASSEYNPFLFFLYAQWFRIHLINCWLIGQKSLQFYVFVTHNSADSETWQTKEYYFKSFKIVIQLFNNFLNGFPFTALLSDIHPFNLTGLQDFGACPVKMGMRRNNYLDHLSTFLIPLFAMIIAEEQKGLIEQKMRW